MHTPVVHPLVLQYPVDGAGITALQDGNSVIHPHKPREVKGHHRESMIRGVHQLEEGEGCLGAGMDSLDRPYNPHASQRLGFWAVMGRGGGKRSLRWCA